MTTAKGAYTALRTNQCAACGAPTATRYCRGHASHAARSLLRLNRALPDYTWPGKLPLDQLRRLVERESAEAIALANAAHLKT